MMNAPTPRPRRRLPRLLLALLLGGAAAALVYTYVQSVQASALREAALRAAQAPAPTATAIPRSKVLVARVDLPAKTLLQPEQFELRELPTEAVAPRAIVSLGDVSGKQLAVPLAAGEQLLASKLLDQSSVETDRLAQMVPPGKRAMSVSFTEVLGSGGLILPGDRVDVIATFKKDVMGKDMAMILLQNVQVLAVAQSTSAEELSPAADGTPTPVPARGAPAVTAVGKAAPGATPAAGGATDKVVPVTPTPASVRAAPPKTKTATPAV